MNGVEHKILSSFERYWNKYLTGFIFFLMQENQIHIHDMSWAFLLNS
jgi:hypothetical protein